MTPREKRLRAAVSASMLLHLLVLVLCWWGLPARTFRLANAAAGPMTVTVLPEEPAPPVDNRERRLVDVSAPAQEPVAPTDLIAVANSKAADTTPRPGDLPGPTGEESDVDRLALPQPAPPAPNPAPPTPPIPPTPEKAAEQNTPTAEKPTPSAAEPSATPPAPPRETPKPAAMQVARAEAPRTRAEDAPTAESAPQTAAAAAVPPAAPPLPTGATRARPGRGVKQQGVKGFEAIQSEIAPYLKEIERAVEIRWREALQLRYSGSRPTMAEIDCEIGPDGRLVSVRIAGTPDDRIYAALCKEAIERAGPFRPFPFKVPDLYRNRNLEIRWSFSFL